MTTDGLKSVSPPRVLAVETSSRAGSALIATGGHIVGEREFGFGFRHAAELMPAIHELCAGAGWRPRGIQQVYLSIGPGSFTGLRTAVALARGLAQAIGAKLVAVPTVDVIAANAPAWVENLVVILDAKRGQVFAARYHRGEDGALFRTAGPALVAPANFVSQTPGPVTITGEGIDYHRPALAGISGWTELEKPLWVPRARAVLKLGGRLAEAGTFADPNTLLPVYIRLAEAEELYNARKAEGGGGR